VALGILRSEGEDAALAEVGRMIEACIAAFEAGDVNAAMTHFVDYWDGPGAWEAIPKAQRLFIYARAEKMHQEVRAVWRDRVALDAYRDISVPTRVLVGADTTRAAKRMAKLLAGALVHADYEALPGAGHMLPMTHAAVLAERLKRDFRPYRQG
jgi:pimeloyl-ACP methyl ester carboxylesterase